MRAISLTSLEQAPVAPYEVVGIDEGQFFADVAEFADQQANKGKVVVVAALSSDFRRMPFPEVASLMAIAERIHHLTAVCRMCGGDAAFSLRKSDHKDIQVIGGQELYEACCRQCYNRFSGLFK